jgi:hypothetical protein
VSGAGNRSCDDERRAGAVLLLLRVSDGLEDTAGIVDKCASSYDSTCDDEYLVMALAVLQDLAEWLPTAIAQLREGVGEDVARRADEMVSRFREYRRRLGCA